MSSLNRFPNGSVNVFSYQEWLSSGLSRADLRASLGSGRLLRARRDVYVVPPVDERLYQSLRIGGRLSCGDALAHRGVWIAPRRHQRVHVALRHPNSRLRDSRGTLYQPAATIDASLHWANVTFGEGDRCAVDPRDALAGELRCRGPEDALAAADSALHTGVLSPVAVRQALGEAHLQGVPMTDLLDPGAESGYETYLRLMLREAGLSFRSQARIPGVGRVDFLVADGLIVEVDGRSAHEHRFAEDRRRDTVAARLGYVTLRIASAQLDNDRPGVLLAIRAHIERLR